MIRATKPSASETVTCPPEEPSVVVNVRFTSPVSPFATVVEEVARTLADAVSPSPTGSAFSTDEGQ